MGDLVAFRKVFDGHPVTRLTYDGRPAFIAKEIGRALGYADDGRSFVSRLAEWADEFVDGKDIIRLDGEELAALKAAMVDVTDCVTSTRRSLTLLFESGIVIACALSRSEVGRIFRRWLADEMLAEVKLAGSYRPERSASAERLSRGLMVIAKSLPKNDPERRRLTNEALRVLNGDTLADPPAAQIRLLLDAPDVVDATAFLEAWRAQFGARWLMPAHLVPLAIEHGVVDSDRTTRGRLTALGRRLVQLVREGALRRRMGGHNATYSLPTSPAA